MVQFWKTESIWSIFTTFNSISNLPIFTGLQQSEVIYSIKAVYVPILEKYNLKTTTKFNVEIGRF